MFNRKEGKLCPMLKKPCIGDECSWFITIRGTHPQTGDPVDQSDCTMVMQPLLMVENSQQQRQTAAAVESFRNEMVSANETSIRLLAATHQNLIGGI